MGYWSDGELMTQAKLNKILKGLHSLDATDAVARTDIWSGSTIYNHFFWKAVSPVVTKQAFLNAIDVDASNKLSGDTVALYTQIKGNATTTADLWGLNTVASKMGTHKVTGAEFDVNNEKADDGEWTESDPCCGVAIGAGGAYHPYVGISISSNGVDQAWNRAIQADSSFRTIGIYLRSSISAPDSYLYLHAKDDDNATARIIKSVNAAGNSEKFAVRKDGVIIVQDQVGTTGDIALAKVGGGTRTLHFYGGICTGYTDT